MANSRHHHPLPLHMPQLCKNTRFGEPGAIGKSIQQRLLQGNLDYHRLGCRLLDGNEDQKEMAQRPGIDSVHGALSDRSGTGGPEGSEG